MSYDISHGVGGLWETWQWNGGIVLNTQDGPDRYFVEKIAGLHNLPEFTDTRDPKVARIGEHAYAAGQLGKTLSLTGLLQHSTLPLLRAARTTMVAAFSDRVNEGYMDVIPHPDVGGPTARFYAKPMALDVPEEIAGPRGFDRSFQLDLRMSDPRFYYPSLAVDVSGNPAAVTNPGDAPADPIITVSGASGTVTVSNGTRTLTFSGVPSGSLVIDFAARTAKVGATRCKLVPASSDWWDRFVDGIAGGASVSISQTGGTGVRVQFTPATWG